MQQGFKAHRVDMALVGSHLKSALSPGNIPVGHDRQLVESCSLSGSDESVTPDLHIFTIRSLREDAGKALSCLGTIRCVRDRSRDPVTELPCAAYPLGLRHSTRRAQEHLEKRGGTRDKKSWHIPF